MPLKRYLVFTICMAFVCASCTEDSNDKLSTMERQKVDTLYTNELKVLRPMLDSVCNVQLDSLVLHLADSLVKVRMAEIDRIMNRQ